MFLWGGSSGLSKRDAMNIIRLERQKQLGTLLNNQWRALKRLDTVDKITLVGFSYHIQLKAEWNYVGMLLNIVMCTTEVRITKHHHDDEIKEDETHGAWSTLWNAYKCRLHFDRKTRKEESCGIKDNISTDLKINMAESRRLHSSVQYRINGGLLWIRQWTCGLRERLGISWPAKRPLNAQKSYRSVRLGVVSHAKGRPRGQSPLDKPLCYILSSMSRFLYFKHM